MPLLFENLIEIRNFHGFYQFRETLSEPWQFVVTGFCFDDLHCHVMAFNRKEIKVSINDKDEILIKGRRYERNNWQH